MKKSTVQLYIIAILYYIISSFSLVAQTDITDSLVSGTWLKANSPYRIYRDIYIKNDSTLTIEPGVTVEFQGHYKLDVQGRILAVGNEADSIKFTVLADSIDVGWNRIKLDNTPETNDSTKFEYCVFEYSKASNKGGVFYIYEFSKIRFENNLFINNETQSNGGAIYVDQSIILLQNNKFINNYSSSRGGAVYYHNSSISTPSYINNNLFYNNQAETGGAIHIDGGSTSYYYFINNTFCRNRASFLGASIRMVGCCLNIYFANCIFWDNVQSNEEEIYNTGDNNYLEIKNCCIQNGVNNISDPPNSYRKIIDKNPFFVDIESGNFQLTDSSYCINYGVIDTTDMKIPQKDIIGNPRIFNGTIQRIDIGAYEYQGDVDNRIPLLVKNDVQNILISDSINLQIEYDDNDIGDSHLISIESLSDKLTINNLSGDTTGSTYTIKPETGWFGYGKVAITVTDQSNKITSLNTDTFTVYVGDLWGVISLDSTLQKDTVNVCGNVTIEDGATLTIPAGTVMNFIGLFKIDVQGRILASGSESDSIYFTVNDSINNEGWNGIRFYDTPETNDSSIFAYCVFEKGKGIKAGALYIHNNSKIIITNCLFKDCYSNTGSGAIYLETTGIGVLNSKFINNVSEYIAGAIYIGIGNNTQIINCLFINNSCSNVGGAVYAGYSQTQIINNTFVNNFSGFGGGALFIDQKYSLVINNIFWGNNAGGIGAEIYISNSSPDIKYNNIQEGMGKIYGTPGSFENNINFDPYFIDEANGNFKLCDSSCCINAGIADTTGLGLPLADIKGNPRIFDDGNNIIDIGVYEYQGFPTPKGVMISSDSIIEKSPENTVVGILSTIDSFPKLDYVYTFDNNELNIDSIHFYIKEDTLFTKTILDFKEKSKYNLYIKTTDDSGKYAVTLIPIFSIDTNNLHLFQGKARSGAVSFVIQDTVYIGLGQDENGVMKDFWRYDPIEDTWNIIDSFPGLPRANAVAFTLNNKAYVGLGRSAYPYEYYKDFYEFDPSSGSWQQLNDFSGTARYGAVSFTVNDTAYVGTGKDASDYLKDFWKYDALSDSWLRITDLDADKRSGAVAFALNGKGYVSGGMYFDSYSVQLSDVQEYDPATDTWTERIFADGINLGFTGATAIIIADKAFICYGNKDEIVSYGPTTNEVENLGDTLSLNDKRNNPVSFVLNDSAYFGLGDYGISPVIYNNDILKIDLPVNFAPTDIILSNDSISENVPLNTMIGSLSTEDNDAGDSHTYSFISGTGDDDNDSFSISGDLLYTNTDLNYENKSTYSILIRTTDPEGALYERQFYIYIKDNNDSPTGITLSNNAVEENSQIGKVVGILNTTDEDTSDLHTYNLITGEGDDDNGNFIIVDNYLMTDADIDFETKPECSIRLRTTDNEGLFYDKPFTVYIEDINEPPVDITLSNDSIKNNAEPGTLVGTFTTDDEDPGDKEHIYTFTSNSTTNSTDSIYFDIKYDSLLIASELDNEKLIYTLLVKSTDDGGLSLTEQFLINMITTEDIKLLRQLPGHIQVYPNPAKDYINISQKVNQKPIEDIVVINSLGEKVSSANNVNTDNYKLDINNLPNGIYYLLIKLEDKYFYEKIMILKQ